MIVDPDNEGRAIDDKGRLVYAVRGIPWNKDRPPTVAELENAPVLGWPVTCEACDSVFCRCKKEKP